MTDAAGLHVDGADPIKLQVEATIRRVVSDVIALPCHVARSLARRVGEPVAMVRSVSELTLGGLTRRWWPVPGAPESMPPRSADVTLSDALPATQVDPASPLGPHPERARVSSAALPLDDYESLAASQVVARLERLDPVELRQVQEFEAAHRGRRTVLGKIDQLLAATSA